MAHFEGDLRFQFFIVFHFVLYVFFFSVLKTEKTIVEKFPL